MTEVKEWDNNPRQMLVWDNDENDKKVRFVIYVDADKLYNVFTLNEDGQFVPYKHCADFKDVLMTNEELYRWLQLGAFRQVKFQGIIKGTWSYNETMEDEPVPDDVLVRKDTDQEWVPPTKVLTEVDK